MALRVEDLGAVVAADEVASVHADGAPVVVRVVVLHRCTDKRRFRPELESGGKRNRYKYTITLTTVRTKLRLQLTLAQKKNKININNE